MGEIELVINNTEQDLEDYRNSLVIRNWHCPKCGHRWVATIGEMMDDPSCRKCCR
jgi:hypothetical protein